MDIKYKNNKFKKLFIEPLEQRIMLDGAGASTFLDLIDERNQQQVKTNSSNKEIYKEGDKTSDIPFTNVARDKVRNDRKNIVFIDSAVQDYEVIINSFKENTEFYLINTTEDGFKKINETLKDRENIDALHLIGHGSAGEILFGNAFLNNETIDSYQSTLASIGQSLTTSGDILFYGCNVASTDQGELLIKKISEITKADIAASDDLTGKDGDWKLENKYGLVETKNVQIVDYNHSLNNAPVAAANTATVNEDDTVTVTGNSATSITYEVNDTADSAINVLTDTSESEGSGVSFSSDGRKMFITGHETNRIHEFTLSTPFDPTTKSYVDSVLLDWNNSDNSSGTDYSDDQGDWVRGHTWKSDGTKLFVMNWDAGLSGDASDSYRILSYDLTTPYDVSTISRSNDYVNTPTSSNSYDTGLTGSVRDLKISSDGTKFYTINKVTGKLMQYTFATAYDLNSSVTVGGPYTLTNVTYPRSIAFSDNGKKLFVGDDATPEIIHQFNLTTAWDASTLVREGSITPDQTAASDPTDDPFGIAFSNDGTKMFIHDINGNDEIKVHSLKTPFNLIDIDGENDGDVLADDTDANSDTLTVTQIAVTGSSNSAVSSGSSYNSSGTSKTGTYGTLRIGADGTYDYVADQSAADALDPGDIVTDSFTYTVSDGTDTDTETLIVTVIGKNDAPVADNETGSVDVSQTLTVTDGTSDVLHGDTDADDSSSLSVFSITATTASGSETAVNIGTAYNSGYTSVTGSYGTLRIGSDGTYQYIAGSSAGTDVFTYKVSDGSTTDDGTLTITVSTSNNAPSATNDTDAVNEDATVTQSSGSSLLVADDTDADSDTLTVTQIAVTGGSNSSVSSSTTYANGTSITGTYGTLVVGANGSYTYTADQSAADALDASDTATDSFTYTVSDGNGGTDTATLIFTVTGVNDAPVGVNDADAVNEDATVTQSSGSGLLTADDTDGDDSSSLSVTQIAVTGGSNSSVAGSSSYNSNFTTVIGTYGTLKVGADGSFSYVADQSAADALDASDTVTESFTYTVSDGTTTDTATLTIIITGVNDAPTATDNTITTNEDTNHIFSTSDFNFSDDDDSGSLNKIKITSLEDDGALQYYNGTAWVDVTLNQEITATDIANNKLRFKPDANENGNSYTSFEFKVSDGTTYSSSANTINVNVTPVNDAPTASNDTASVTEGSSATVSNASSGVIDDNDTDNDSSDTLTITNISHTNGNSSSVAVSTTYLTGTSIVGTYGTLTIGADGTYTYTPNDTLGSGETGDDVFTYTVSDGTTTDTATITVSVTGANDAPVGVNDSNEIDISKETTLTVSNGSVKDVLTNDSDADSNDTVTVTEIRTGALEGSGTSGTVGSSLTGTYGSLTINANGSYTYVVNDGLKDTIGKGDIIYEYFNYTVSDSSLTDTGTITLKLQNGGKVNNDIKENKSERLIRKEAKKAEKKLKLPKIESIFKPNLNNLELPKIDRKQTFSQGLKLTDLVAETESIEIKNENVSLDKLKVKTKKDTLNLKFKIFNESSDEVIRFEGRMKDGSPLPDWIKVDPKTGTTKTKIPKGTDNVEITIIAIDDKNDRREISVKIDPKQILEDKQILKQAKKTNSNISVDDSGNVNVIKNNEDGSINQTTSKILNLNNNSDIVDIIKSKKADQLYTLKPNIVESELVINLPSELSESFKTSKLVLKDGSEMPDWIKFDPITGKILADPPDDVLKLDLKLIIEKDGDIIVKDLLIEFSGDNNDQTNNLNYDFNHNKFVSLNDQLVIEDTNWDDYGVNVINRL